MTILDKIEKSVSLQVLHLKASFPIYVLIVLSAVFYITTPVKAADQSATYNRMATEYLNALKGTHAPPQEAKGAPAQSCACWIWVRPQYIHPGETATVVGGVSSDLNHPCPVGYFIVSGLGSSNRNIPVSTEGDFTLDLKIPSQGYTVGAVDVTFTAYGSQGTALCSGGAWYFVYPAVQAMLSCNPTELKIGQATDCHVNADNARSPCSVQWFPSGGSSFDPCFGGTNASFTFDVAGEHHVSATVTDALNNSGIAIAFVNVSAPALGVQLSAGPDPVAVGQACGASATVTNATPPISCTFNFAGANIGATGTSSCSASYAFSTPGTNVPVSVVVEDKNNVQGFDTVLVTVIQPQPTCAPNVPCGTGCMPAGADCCVDTGGTGYCAQGTCCGASSCCSGNTVCVGGACVSNSCPPNYTPTPSGCCPNSHPAGCPGTTLCCYDSSQCCGAAGCCDPTDVCAGPGCCPSETPLVCPGTTACCDTLSHCGSGGCCSTGIICGDGCCGSGSQCCASYPSVCCPSQDQCAPTGCCSAGSVYCGTGCCPTSVGYCSGGQCYARPSSSAPSARSLGATLVPLMEVMPGDAIEVTKRPFTAGKGAMGKRFPGDFLRESLDIPVDGLQQLFMSVIEEVRQQKSCK